MSIAIIRNLAKGSSGVIVSYYDGQTLIGTNSVHLGDDVLHPSIIVPSKVNYTFVGWATSNNITDWVDTLVSDGQPMNLYAMYVPNTLTVVNGGTIVDSYYISGSCSAGASVRGEYQHSSGSASFTLDKKFYANASGTAKAYWDDHGTQSMKVGDATFDGTYITEWGTAGGTFTLNITPGNGTHTLVVNVDGLSWSWTQYGSVSVTITLSNPTAWT